MKNLTMILALFSISACATYTVTNQEDDIKTITHAREICKQGYEYLEKASDARREALAREQIGLCGARLKFLDADTPEIRSLDALFSSGTPKKEDVVKGMDLAEKSIKEYKFKQ